MMECIGALSAPCDYSANIFLLDIRKGKRVVESQASGAHCHQA
jgi:hypothetical protein